LTGIAEKSQRGFAKDTEKTVVAVFTINKTRQKISKRVNPLTHGRGEGTTGK